MLKMEGISFRLSQILLAKMVYEAKEDMKKNCSEINTWRRFLRKGKKEGSVLN